jgi:hypothetical protein
VPYHNVEMIIAPIEDPVGSPNRDWRLTEAGLNTAFPDPKITVDNKRCYQVPWQIYTERPSPDKQGIWVPYERSQPDRDPQFDPETGDYVTFLVFSQDPDLQLTDATVHFTKIRGEIDSPFRNVGGRWDLGPLTKLAGTGGMSQRYNQWGTASGGDKVYAGGRQYYEVSSNGAWEIWFHATISKGGVTIDCAFDPKMCVGGQCGD